MEEKLFFKNSKGLKLCGILNKNKKKNLIILAHGLTVDKNEYGTFIKLAEKLKNYFDVFRFDFSGHGESEGNYQNVLISQYLLDLQSVFNFIKKHYQKIGLLGASFGGGIAALFTAKNQSLINSLCLWNPCLNYKNIFLKPYLPWLKNKIKNIYQDFQNQGWSTIGSRKFKIDKKLFEEMEIFFPYKEIKKINIPVLIIHGDKDQHVPYEDSKKYSYYLKNGDFITIKNSSHGFHKKPYQNKAINLTLQFFKKTLY